MQKADSGTVPGARPGTAKMAGPSLMVQQGQTNRVEHLFLAPDTAIRRVASDQQRLDRVGLGAANIHAECCPGFTVDHEFLGG